MDNYETAAYMTAAKLGETTGVSESTVVRFSMELGYEGYPHFQKAGYRFVSTYIPYKWRQSFESITQYSYYIFFALILLDHYGNVSILSKIVEWIEYPFRWPIDKICAELLWNLVGNTSLIL